MIIKSNEKRHGLEVCTVYAVFESNDINILAKKVQGFRGFAPMFHAHMEVVYVMRGSIKLRIDGFQHTLTSGQMSVCFPYLIHSYDESPEAEAIILLFSPSVVGEFAHKLMQYKPSVPFVEDASAFLPLLKRIVACRKTKDSDNELLATAYISALVGEFLISQSLDAVENMDFSVAQKILQYCSEHYLEDLSVKQVAQSLHVSESCVTKTFSSKLNCPFRKYINALRLADAKKLLRSTDRKIIDIMLACGFNNQSRFNALFYEDTGLTPREYRTQQRR